MGTGYIRDCPEIARLLFQSVSVVWRVRLFDRTPNRFPTSVSPDRTSHATMARKLPFRVVYWSSGDDDYPATDLQVHSPLAKGWRSSRLRDLIIYVIRTSLSRTEAFELDWFVFTCRFCIYPQEVVVQLSEPVRLRKLQLLSHQYLIGEAMNECSVSICWWHFSHVCYDVIRFLHSRIWCDIRYDVILFFSHWFVVTSYMSSIVFVSCICSFQGWVVHWQLPSRIDKFISELQISKAWVGVI